jgi:hypothetical protein
MTSLRSAGHPDECWSGCSTSIPPLTMNTALLSLTIAALPHFRDLCGNSNVPI